MIWKSVRDTNQQNKSHNVPYYTSIPELHDHKIQTLFPLTESLKDRAKVALAFSRRSDSRVRCKFREQEKTRGERGGKACGISFKKVILPTLSGTPFFN